MTKRAVKLTRTQQRPITLRILKEQGGICPLCELPIETTRVAGTRTDYALDHCHETGVVRGVLHRSCNGALGKLDNAIGRWGAKSMQYSAIVPYLERVLEYYKREPYPYIYPTHKSPEERAEAARVRRNQMQARRRAAAKAREVGK